MLHRIERVNEREKKSSSLFGIKCNKIHVCVITARGQHYIRVTKQK